MGYVRTFQNGVKWTWIPGDGARAPSWAVLTAEEENKVRTGHKAMMPDGSYITYIA